MSVQYGVTPEKMGEIVGDDIKYLRKEVEGRKAMQLLLDTAVIEEIDPEETPEAPETPAE